MSLFSALLAFSDSLRHFYAGMGCVFSGETCLPAFRQVPLIQRVPSFLASYALLDLITYFTAGPKEVRAWTNKKGWNTQKAVGFIHTDFEKGFIKAEVKN